MSTPRERIDAVLGAYHALAVAVSGGVDSVTLAALATERLGRDHVTLFHAVSPAVPPEATDRVRRLARQEGWRLEVIDAGEFTDPEYVRNPVNRCYHCKAHLYGAIRARAADPIASGANLDDLGEYRPGLAAAREHGVRHPFVEAQVTKADVRVMARALELADVADLPASPCLASRVETGIPIAPPALRLVHEVETLVAAALVAWAVAPATVRCRIRAAGVVVELDAACLDRLSEATRAELLGRVGEHLRARGMPPARLALAAYRLGSAFLTTSA